MSEYKIALIVGSLRRDSFNRKLAGGLTKLAPPDFTFQDLQIGDLPLYNQDDDASQAAPVKRLKAEIAAANGVLFVTPEYIRSIPGVLKNAIDNASRPYGQNAWAGKQAGVLGISSGRSVRLLPSSICAPSSPISTYRRLASLRPSCRRRKGSSRPMAASARPAGNSCRAGWIDTRRGSGSTTLRWHSSQVTTSDRTRSPERRMAAPSPPFCPRPTLRGADVAFGLRLPGSGLSAASRSAFAGLSKPDCHFIRLPRVIAQTRNRVREVGTGLAPVSWRGEVLGSGYLV